jgi:hypothetical protein
MCLTAPLQHRQLPTLIGVPTWWKTTHSIQRPWLSCRDYWVWVLRKHSRAMIPHMIVYFPPFSSLKEGARPAGSLRIFCVGAAVYIGLVSGDIEATNRCHRVAISTSSKDREERN